MKKLRITVNGTIYEVLVEVLEDDDHIASGPGFGTPAAPPPSASPAKPKTRVAAPQPSGGVRPRDPAAIAAPIAGTVQKVFVEPGTHVEEKTPLILLDAMKMDTYIYAPRTGEIAAVRVGPGDAVQVGDELIRYTTEG